MIKLLIIADDFTGALDTGVQFADKGIETKVTTDIDIDFATISKSAQVLVIDSETRPLSKEKAYEVVYKITKKGAEAGIDTIYKKTDSALRGNIGSELTALLEGGRGTTLSFIPAFPKVNRITKKGVHYLGNIPINESAFGKDPFEPVTSSYIPEIIKKQSNVKVVCFEKEDGFDLSLNEEKQIAIFDTETDEDISRIAGKLKEQNSVKLLAGCAGFASHLPEVLGLIGDKKLKPKKTDGMFIACGSLNPITKEQVEYAVSKGFIHINLTPEQKLNEKYYEKEEGKFFLKQIAQICRQNVSLIMDTFDIGDSETAMQYVKEQGIKKEDVRSRIAACLGRIIKSLIESGIHHTYIITGGDTLMGFMKQINCTQLHPVCEIEQGTVLSYMDLGDEKLQIVSKSGGFGEKDVFVSLAEKIINK